MSKHRKHSFGKSQLNINLQFICKALQPFLLILSGIYNKYTRFTVKQFEIQGFQVGIIDMG